MLTEYLAYLRKYREFFSHPMSDGFFFDLRPINGTSVSHVVRRCLNIPRTPPNSSYTSRTKVKRAWGRPGIFFPIAVSHTFFNMSVWGARGGGWAHSYREKPIKIMKKPWKNMKNPWKIHEKPKNWLSSILFYFNSVASRDISCASPTSLSWPPPVPGSDRDVGDTQEMSLDATELK